MKVKFSSPSIKNPEYSGGKIDYYNETYEFPLYI